MCGRPVMLAPLLCTNLSRTRGTSLAKASLRHSQPRIRSSNVGSRRWTDEWLAQALAESSSLEELGDVKLQMQQF